MSSGILSSSSSSSLSLLPTGTETSHLTPLPAPEQNASHHVELGEGYRQKRDMGKAKEHFQIAIKLDADNGLAHARLGALLRWQDNTTLATDSTLAETHLRKALKLGVDDAITHIALGKILGYRFKLEEADDHLTRGLQLDTTDAVSHTLLGAILHHQDKLSRAKLHLMQALELDQENSVAHELLGKISTRDQEELFEERTSLYDDASRAFNDKDYKGAIAKCEELLALDKIEPLLARDKADFKIKVDIIHLLCQAHLKEKTVTKEVMQYFDQAFYLFTKFVNPYLKAQVLMLQGSCFKTLNNPEQALVVYRKVAAMKLDNATLAKHDANYKAFCVDEKLLNSSKSRA